MSGSGEFYTFEETMNELKIDEGKLKRYVSEGEIRAFREGDEMKFKKTDIDTLEVRDPEDDGIREIDLVAGGAEASETLTDDLIFDEGDELDLSSDGYRGATAEITSRDTFVDEEGEPVGMSTEPLDFSDKGFDEEPEYVEPETITGTEALKRYAKDGLRGLTKKDLSRIRAKHVDPDGVEKSLYDTEIIEDYISGKRLEDELELGDEEPEPEVKKPEEPEKPTPEKESGTETKEPEPEKPTPEKESKAEPKAKKADHD